MPTRTYYPGAVKAAASCHRYLTRWQPKLLTTVDDPQAAELAALITELGKFLALWPAPAILPLDAPDPWMVIHLVKDPKAVEEDQNG